MRSKREAKLNKQCMSTSRFSAVCLKEANAIELKDEQFAFNRKMQISGPVTRW